MRVATYIEAKRQDSADTEVTTLVTMDNKLCLSRQSRVKPWVTVEVAAEQPITRE